MNNDDLIFAALSKNRIFGSNFMDFVTKATTFVTEHNKQPTNLAPYFFSFGAVCLLQLYVGRIDFASIKKRLPFHWRGFSAGFYVKFLLTSVAYIWGPVWLLPLIPAMGATIDIYRNWESVSWMNVFQRYLFAYMHVFVDKIPWLGEICSWATSTLNLDKIPYFTEIYNLARQTIRMVMIDYILPIMLINKTLKERLINSRNNFFEFFFNWFGKQQIVRQATFIIEIDGSEQLDKMVEQAKQNLYSMKIQLEAQILKGIMEQSNNILTEIDTKLTLMQARSV